MVLLVFDAGTDVEKNRTLYTYTDAFFSPKATQKNTHSNISLSLLSRNAHIDRTPAPILYTFATPFGIIIQPHPFGGKNEKKIKKYVLGRYFEYSGKSRDDMDVLTKPDEILSAFVAV